MILERICEVSARQPFAVIFGKVKREGVGVFAQAFIGVTEPFAVGVI